jgi:hypothetical protein
LVVGNISVLSSPGATNTPTQIWNGGGHFQWNIFDPTGAVGSGWDFMSITGRLSFTATTSNKFNLDVTSFTSTTNTPGNIANFNNATGYVWRLLTASRGIDGINTNVINLNTSGFSNALGSGYFVLELATNNLVLRFNHTPVANADSVQRPTGQGTKIATSTLVSNDTDADGDTLSVVSVTAATSGGGTATGTVAVTLAGENVSMSRNLRSIQPVGQAYHVHFSGIPGFVYTIQYTESLIPPVAWTTLGTAQLGSNGQGEYSDTPPANAASRFYRTTYP